MWSVESQLTLRKQEIRALLDTFFLQVSCLAYILTFNMGAMYSSRTVLYRILRSGQNVCFILLSCFGLLSNPEIEGAMFLRNVIAF
jgi:hypothetical protein